MWDCRTQGGHFFLFTPQLRSFTCHRCRTSFPNHNLPVPRLGSYSPPPGLREPRKMPWRCLLESCSFVCCDTCADFLQKELARINELRIEAEESKTPFDARAMALQAETEVSKKEDGGMMKTVVEAVVRGPRDLERQQPRKKENIREVVASFQGPIEVDSEDDEDPEEVYVALRRPFTRSVAVAAAAARSRVPVVPRSNRRIPMDRQEV